MVMRLTEVNLLEALKQPEYAELRSSFVERTFSRGEILFSPEMTTDKVLVVAHGRIRVYLAYEAKEFTLSYLEKGDIFSTHTRTFGVAEQNTTLLLADVSIFREHLLSFPELTGTMIRVLGNILRNSFSVIGSLAFKDIKRRLCDFLLSQAAQSSERDQRGVVVRLGLTIEELARLLGATRQTVSTLLNDLERSGVIVKIGRGTYSIQDVSGLEENYDS